MVGFIYQDNFRFIIRTVPYIVCFASLCLVFKFSHCQEVRGWNSLSITHGFISSWEKLSVTLLTINVMIFNSGFPSPWTKSMAPVISRIKGTKQTNKHKTPHRVMELLQQMLLLAWSISTLPFYHGYQILMHLCGKKPSPGDEWWWIQTRRGSLGLLSKWFV